MTISVLTIIIISLTSFSILSFILWNFYVEPFHQILSDESKRKQAILVLCTQILIVPFFITLDQTAIVTLETQYLWACGMQVIASLGTFIVPVLMHYNNILKQKIVNSKQKG